MLPRDVFPPEGDIASAAAAEVFRALIFDGTVKVLAEGTDRTAINAHYVASRFPAAFVRGATVLKHNDRGRAHARAFAAFAAAPQAAVEPDTSKPSKAPRALPAQTTAEPMPEREPAAPVVASVEASASRREAVKVPVACLKCGAEPRAHVTKRTKPGTESWGSKCRKVAPSKAPRPAPKRAANSPKSSDGSTSKQTPSKAPKAALLSLDAALSLVERDAALIARLGGHTIAEGLAGLCEQHGGPAALVAAVRRVVALANGRG